MAWKTENRADRLSLLWFSFGDSFYAAREAHIPADESTANIFRLSNLLFADLLAHDVFFSAHDTSSCDVYILSGCCEADICSWNIFLRFGWTCYQTFFRNKEPPVFPTTISLFGRGRADCPVFVSRVEIFGEVKLRIENDKWTDLTFKFMNLSPFSIALINKFVLNLRLSVKSIRSSRESGPKK